MPTRHPTARTAPPHPAEKRVLARSGRRQSPRAVAAQVVARTLDEAAFGSLTLRHALSDAQLEPRDTAFATELVYGTLTWLRPVDHVLEAWLTQGMQSLPPIARSVLRVGAYELLRADRPAAPHAAVGEAVEAMRQLGLPHLAGLCNAVLRRVSEFGEPIAARCDNGSIPQLAATGSIPDWLAERLVAQRGLTGAAAAVDRWNGTGAMHLRLRPTAEEESVRAALEAAGLEVSAHPWMARCLVVRGGNPLIRCPELKDHLAVMDAAAQAVVRVAVGQQAVHRAWDVCAGLGSKSLALADALPDASILSTDIHEPKLRAASRALKGVPSARTLAHDATLGPPPGDGDFDLVLLDAPCSGLGTIGRHPEIRWRRTPDDIAQAAALQRRLLAAAADAVGVGGRLVYAVCSWTPDESTAIVEAFLQSRSDFEPTHDEAPLSGATPPGSTGTGLTLWPDLHACDGFFVAGLRRVC
jgi:16S rRNA (cytosine967-C5)-methyltransferase